MTKDDPDGAPRVALHANQERRPTIPTSIRICMTYSTLFTAEMVARYGGNVLDIRRDLDRLARLGVLVKRSQRYGVDFFHGKI